MNASAAYEVIFRNFAITFAVLVLAACSGTRALMPAPNYYQGEQSPPLFTDLPEELRSSKIDMLYVTDRHPETDEDGRMFYGYQRSNSLAFGSAIVSLEPEISWEELERLSLAEERSPEITMEFTSVEEMGRFPKTPWPLERTDEGLQLRPDVAGELHEVESEVQTELRRRLELSPKSEVLMFVHGYNNQFDDAAKTLAELWHFLGREYVPLLYTWPAGRGGIRGYTYDRESGEFTIFHLKNTLQLLAGMPEIEKIHIVAHSRGTDVLSAALRELLLVSRAAGNNNLEEYRIENVILAAPDLDLDVALQRLAAETLSEEVGEVTFYTSKSDRALGAAAALFVSRARMGMIGLESVDKSRIADLKVLEGLSFVDLKKRADSTGHGYFHSSPEASSDLIMTLRYGLKPGAESGRPLNQLGPIFWSIEPGYPYDVESAE